MRQWWALQREMQGDSRESKDPQALPGTSLESTFTEMAHLTAATPPPEGDVPKEFLLTQSFFPSLEKIRNRDLLAQFQWEAPNSDLDLLKKNGITVLAVEQTFQKGRQQMTQTFTGLRDFLYLPDTVVGMLTLFHYQGMCTCIFITLVSYNTPGQDSWQNNSTYHC